MPLYTQRVIAKRRALAKQATHTDVKGRLFKFVGGHPWMLQGAILWGLDIPYPVYSKVTEHISLKPIQETPL